MWTLEGKEMEESWSNTLIKGSQDLLLTYIAFK